MPGTPTQVMAAGTNRSIGYFRIHMFHLALGGSFSFLTRKKQSTAEILSCMIEKIDFFVKL